MTVTSGRRCLELLNKRDPFLSLLKTWLVTSPWASTRCWLTWRVKATPGGRLLFQLVPSMPRTEGTGSGSSLGHWPTPVADGDRAVNYKQGGTSLGYAARMWATPTAVEWKGRGPNSKQQGLAEQAKMWPTPRSSEHKDCGPVGSKSHTHMLDRKYLCAATKESDRPTGKLNPQWVEWLMGYPVGWTDLGD